MQADLFSEQSYPSSPGFKARDTSKAAAEAIAPRAPSIRDRALEALKANPGTADEIADRIGEHFLAVRPRLSQAAAQGLVVDTGARRPNASGKSAIVWAVSR